MNTRTFLATLAISVAAAASQAVPFLPPALVLLGGTKNPEEKQESGPAPRFSIPAADENFIQFVIYRAQRHGLAIRTSREAVNGVEFVNIWVSKRK